MSGIPNPDRVKQIMLSINLTLMAETRWSAMHRLSKNRNVKAHKDKYDNAAIATIHFVGSSGFHVKGPSMKPKRVKTWQLNNETSKHTCTALSLYTGLKKIDTNKMSSIGYLGRFFETAHTAW
jgi:hypothetical protein